MLKKYQGGFTAIELVLLAALVAVIGAAAYFAYQNHQHAVRPTASSRAATPSPSVSPSPASNQLAITQWGVSMTLPAGLSGLTYNFTKTLDTGAPEADIISPKLKGQPSLCSDQTTTDGSLASIVRTDTVPTAFDNEAPPADQLRHIGSYYYQLVLPNGSSCQKSPDLQAQEASQLKLLEQAFQTLK